VGETLGDIFWDLPPWIYYSPEYDVGCTIYVANNTDTDREYSLLLKLYRQTAVGLVLLSETSLPVSGSAWFTVASNDFVRLAGSIRPGTTDVIATVELVESEKQDAVDSVSTVLVKPTTAAVPPEWTGGAIISSQLPLLMMIIMMMVMMTSVLGTKEEEKKLEEKKRLAERAA